MNIRQFGKTGLISKILSSNKTCLKCILQRSKTSKSGTTNVLKENHDVGKTQTQNGQEISYVQNSPATHRKQTSEIDFILKYPLVRCKKTPDNSVLKESAGMLLPAVTSIMSETMSDMSRFYLERWKNLLTPKSISLMLQDFLRCQYFL